MDAATVVKRVFKQPFHAVILDILHPGLLRFNESSEALERFCERCDEDETLLYAEMLLFDSRNGAMVRWSDGARCEAVCRRWVVLRLL